jgi:DNA polymerase-3 subunit gamma/tau
MEHFVVSARKYRPVTFDTVVGQPNITVTLKNAIRSNHVAQAFLFTGPRGVGKTTTARILAKTINCERITADTEACNTCDSCKSFNSGHSLNIYELDAASNNSVDDIRKLVEQVRYAPQGGRYKVYIIDEVHMLSSQAFNAFLKTLEEPPAYAVFILATTEKHKVIPTILSRCQIFDFNRITVDDITAHLANIARKEQVDAEEEALHIIAQKSDGALRDALSMFDQMVSFAGNRLTYKDVIQNLNMLDVDYYFRVTDELLEGSIPLSFLTLNEVLANGFDGHNFINGLAGHLRDLLVCRDAVTLPLLQVSPRVREKYSEQSSRCPAPWLLSALEAASQCDIQYRSARNQRLHVELCLLRICGYAHAPVPPVQAVPAPDKKKAEPAAAVVSAKASAATAAPVTQAAPAAPAPAAPPAATHRPQPPRPKAQPVNRLISIKEMMEKPGEAAPAEQPREAEHADRPVDTDALHRSWKAFAGILREQGKMALAAALEKRMPELQDADLHFLIDHAGLESDLNEVRSDLLSFLRKDLSNSRILLTTEVARIESAERKAYTPKEIYSRMAEKNPAIHDLKSQLGLDIDY